MSTELNVLRPQKEVPTSLGRIEVHEMAWPDALAFTGKLADFLPEFIQPDGKVVISGEKVARVISGSVELAEFLVRKSVDKEDGWFRSLRPTDGLSLLEAAVELNIHEELLGKAQGVLQRVMARLGAAAPAGSS
ncbi:MAG: hypothetical protein H7A46_26100 [Verrucomicrobiales bacterium]|nr:hypothetical protein [Verrucomicrobiales bacterium]